MVTKNSTFLQKQAYGCHCLSSSVSKAQLMEVLGLQTIRLQPSYSSIHTRTYSHRGLVSVRCGIAEPSGEPAPLEQKTKYKDGVFEKVFMALFAHKMEKFSSSSSSSASGKKKLGLLDYDYDSFVDVSRKVMQGRNQIQQQELVRDVLLSMLPPGAPEQLSVRNCFIRGSVVRYVQLPPDGVDVDLLHDATRREARGG